MPLTYRDRGTSGTQLDVLCGDVIVANVHKNWSTVMYKKDETWNWYMRQEYGPEGYQKNGSAQSLAEAKAHVEGMWTMWLKAAGLRE